MIGKTMPGNVLLQDKISQLQAQLTQALNAYKATGNESSLVTALRRQTHISDHLLNATAMSTPTVEAQGNTIKTLPECRRGTDLFDPVSPDGCVTVRVRQVLACAGAA